MDSSGWGDRPTYATSLLAPFAEVLEEYEEIPELFAGNSETVDGRVLVETAHRWLEIAVARTGDPDLGLRASRRLVLGAIGTVDYVVSSSPTVRDAVEAAARYIRLVNDALEVRLTLDGPSAIVRFDNCILSPRAAIDFEVGGFFRNHVHEWFEGSLRAVTVCFEHEAPTNVAEYVRTFEPATVKFNAAFVGLVFDRALVDTPLKKADPNLHATILPYAEQTLSQLASAKTVTADVRKRIDQGLGRDCPDIVDVASALGMSIRTLARRLESEGTTFRELVDQERKRRALELVGTRDTDFSTIAGRLGFSQTAAFHRAFRRWTGQTPLTYRRLRRP